ncbi:hypothetical protein MNV49_006170 [Pseudohyphozyma bogoriensis]|nr:hypothetical protein MNV49_006170 [Pseudohyphozyma bogoriensis]
MSASLEEYILLLLSDSNLPTGGFIASSGLESYVQHGFLPSSDAATKTAGIIAFTRRSVHSYAALNLPFFAGIHAAVAALRCPGEGEGVERAYVEVKRLDDLNESMMLNHIARRASTAQGVALLTLYERALAGEEEVEGKCKKLVEKLRMGIRKGEVYGHLVTGLAVLTASLGLSIDASKHLFLFLHARSLLSSAIRMNVIGPYVSHRLLLHDVRPLVEEALASNLTTKTIPIEDDGMPGELGATDEDGPATTWPLGEILATRHDLLHSKIFNS